MASKRPVNDKLIRFLMEHICPTQLNEIPGIVHMMVRFFYESFREEYGEIDCLEYTKGQDNDHVYWLIDRITLESPIIPERCEDDSCIEFNAKEQLVNELTEIMISLKILKEN